MMVIKDNCGIINYQLARSRRNFPVVDPILELDWLTLLRDFQGFPSLDKIESAHNDASVLW